MKFSKYYGTVRFYAGWSDLDKATDEGQNYQYAINPKRLLGNVVGQYPLTIYGTFGITNSKHGIKMYPLHKSYGRYLLSDLVQKHQLQKKYADHLYKATTNGLDPRRTNLLSGNEAIIDSDHSTPCPLTSGMVHLIQCCPTQS
ncbi:unnamed protein product [Adineta steineri]|uniref:Uncharacterized protein n=1 Tax=Adineta steineri TaxID=433720 RepID=A0A819SQ25_9BILA|nr:unnamed protein product [Adineta steineri]